MSSSIVVDRDRGEAAVVLGNTTQGVNDLAFDLVGLSSPPRSVLSTALDDPAGTLVGIVLPLMAGSSLLAAVRGGWGRRPSGPVRRTRVVSSAAGALFLFAVAFAYATPTWLTAPFWLAGCALAGAAAGIAALTWRSMDPDSGTGGRLRWTGAAVGAVLAVLLAVGVGGAFV